MSELLKITKTEGPVPILHFEGNLDGRNPWLWKRRAKFLMQAANTWLSTWAAWIW